jgi:hypothetical protein
VWVEVEGTTRWQAVLDKSQSKRRWRRSGAQGGRWFLVRVRVSVGEGGVENMVAAVLDKSQSKRGWRQSGAQGGRRILVRARVIVGGGRVKDKVVGGSQ